MNRNLIIALIVSGGVLGGGLAIFYLLRRLLQLPRHVKREIAKDVNVSEIWVEFTPTKKMKISRRFQAVRLRISDARYNTETDQMFLSNGTDINPEVQILDVDGNRYPLNHRSFGAGKHDAETSTFTVGSVSYETRDPKLPSNGEFKTIRIRSENPFTCKTVVWRNYNLK